MLLQPFLKFLKDKTHMLSNIFVEYWILKKNLLMLVQKQFYVAKFDPKTYKKPKFS